MFRRSSILTLSLALAFVAACKKDKGAPPPSSGSAMTGSGSTAAGSDTGSGSAMAGSGSAGSGSSAMAGSGSDSGTGSGSAMAGSDAGSGANAGSAAGSGDSAFDKLSHDDKVKFMKTKVMAPMKVAFQKFDAKEYASFTCKTCHGKDPQKSKFKMPTPDLPKLDFAKLKAGDDKEVAEFMAKVVMPDMAKILGKHEMTQTEPTGFGCLACHTQKK